MHKMLAIVTPILLVGLVAVGPLLWRVWLDRREERALRVRADVHAAVRRALRGDSLVSVEVEAPTPWRAGRVIVSAPAGWEASLASAWSRALEHVPAGYELVVEPPLRRAEAPTASAPAPLRRAA